jgi:hypothetical protein
MTSRAGSRVLRRKGTGSCARFCQPHLRAKHPSRGYPGRGAVAKARVGIGNDAVLELELEKTGENWRVTRVLNVRELYEKSKRK